MNASDVIVLGAGLAGLAAARDQWVCGYLQGAVRTGRAAAAAVLTQGT